MLIVQSGLHRLILLGSRIVSRLLGRRTLWRTSGVRPLDENWSFIHTRELFPTPSVAGEYPDDWQGGAAFPAAPEFRLEARGSIEPREELELGFLGHLVGFVHQDHVKLASRRVVLAEIAQAVESGHVAFLTADVVKSPRKLVGEGHAERRLPATWRSNQQDRHRPGRFQ